MKKILFLLTVLSLFGLFSLQSPMYGQQSWTITQFQSDITLQEDGIVTVDETITADFGSLEKRGIIRDLPVVYTKDSGEKLYTQVQVASVVQNNVTAQYDTYREGDYLRVKIGDPDRTISGIQKYKIVYTAKGVLRSFPEYDEFYWNVTGDTWDVPILEASASVMIPFEGIKGIQCFIGYSGSTVPCETKSFTTNSATFSTINLSERQGLTVVLAYGKNVIPILTVEPPPDPMYILFNQWTFAGFLTTFLVGSILVIRQWYKRGRDMWWRVPSFIGTSKEEIKPIGAKESIVVEYTPPESLPPAILGTLIDERADTLDVTSTIIDLATKGYLTITEHPKKWLFGSVDYTLKKTGKDRKSLLSYETKLLTYLFEDGDEIKLSELKKAFYTELADVKKALYKDVVDLKLFAESPESTRTKYFVVTAILIVVSVVAIFNLIGFLFGGGDPRGKEFIGPIIGILAGLFPVGVLLLFFARQMPRRTAYGREVMRRFKGYKLFISGAEKYKQQFFEKKNLFNEVLPYAIVLGLTGKFAKAMEDMGIKPETTGWYYGTTHFNAMTFSSHVNDFSSSMSQAIASAPSSSSGFSSGGGFSGGGFGGGGGSSW